MYPKLDLACSRNDLRPAINFIHINKDYVVATDANILALHRTEKLFPDVIPFMESLGEKEIFIYGPKWKAANRKLYSDWEFDIEKKEISCYRIKKPYDKLIIPFIVGADLDKIDQRPSYTTRYPKYENVFSSKENRELSRICINPGLLNNLAQALVPEPHRGCQLEFCGESQGIIVFATDQDGNPYKDGIGLIMPVMLNDSYDTLLTSKLYQELLRR